MFVLEKKKNDDRNISLKNGRSRYFYVCVLRIWDFCSFIILKPSWVTFFKFQLCFLRVIMSLSQVYVFCFGPEVSWTTNKYHPLWFFILFSCCFFYKYSGVFFWIWTARRKAKYKRRVYKTSCGPCKNIKIKNWVLELVLWLKLFQLFCFLC